MRKLELSDIASYLPYDLDCLIKGKYNDSEEDVYTIIGIEKMDTITWVKMYNEVSYGISSVKPILRPMSDLAKPIVVMGYNNGEEFVPIDVLKKQSLVVFLENKAYRWDNPAICFCNLMANTFHYNGDSIAIIDLLNQWHFDYRDLIGQELAVNINDLNKRI